VTNPIPADQPVVLYAQVAAPPGVLATPGGTVSFFDGSELLGLSTLEDGFASLTVSFSIAGDHPIVAAYGGDSLFLPSISTVLSQTVTYPQPPPKIASCRPTSSLTTLVQGSSVTAYVPNGNWMSSAKGILVVPIEPLPAASPTAITTPGVVNSCSANPVTGQTVCTANDNDVYLISGSSLDATLTSGATGAASFSGGRCANCGVTINAVTNTAVITIGDSSAPSGSGLQFLNLNTKTFSAPIPAANVVSEDVLWDPGRNLILSPDEEGTYDLFDTSKSPPVEYGYSVGGTLDSAAEDCLTGIALSTDEFTSNLFISDLTQAKYVPGSPGTWTTPSMFLDVTDFDPFVLWEAGTDGIAVAPGTHLGIATGEFPSPPSTGNGIIVFELPSSSGKGTPAYVDWAVVALPNDPTGNPFSMGCDPHTVTAYISPATGKAVGLVSDYGAVSCSADGTPVYLGLIDLKGVLNAPRVAGTHAVSPSYDLQGNGVVSFVKTQ
jgi:Bacterial Ig-like domain (group 3)